jgi:tocopherol cyclase
MWNLHTQLHPEMYHGRREKPPFFEGWYFKVVSADEQQRYAIIPGVILGANGHAFIQVLDGSTGASAYHTFPLSEFWASEDKFEISIGQNRFSRERISLHIDAPGEELQGELRFSGITPWPVSLLSPGIMGWYAWTPRMECYHGVVSLNHAIQGKLTIKQQEIDFTQGNGYTEKDWGQSFPSAWVWFQSNHFDQPAVCITASVATIPWMRSTFQGFIVGFWYASKLYRFATYTGAKSERLEIGLAQIDWVLSSRQYRLELHAERTQGGLLRGPTKVEMGKRVNETLLATVDVRLSTSSGETVFSGQGRNAGLEVNGELK